MSEQTPETPPETPESEPEAPDTEEEEAAEEEPEQPQEPSQGVSQVDMEKAMRSLGREQDRHAKRLGEIMGADFEVHDPCPLCDTMGYVPAGTRMVQARKFDPEANAFVEVRGAASELDDLRYDEDAKPCKRCDAQGRLLTGSKVQGNETKMCPDCSGAGYVTTTNVHEFVPAAPQVDEDPRVAALKAEGYFVTPPYRPEQSGTT